MLANFFGKSKPVNFILITLLFLGYVIFDFIIDANFEFSLRYFTNSLVAFPFFLVLFFLFNFVISKNKLTRDNSYAFLLFVIGLGFLEIVQVAYTTVLIYLLLFLFLRRVYSLRRVKSVYQKLFDSGLWLGILFIFSPAYLLYLVLLYTAVFLFVKITVRTVLIPILGLITPVILYFTYLFWNDNLTTFYQLFEVVLIIDIDFYLTNYYGLFLMLFMMFSAISIIVRTTKILSVSNKFKRSWVLLLVHLAIAILFVFFVKNKNGSELISFLIPASIIIANWLQFVEKKIIINIVLMLFFLLSFAIHFIV